jgi:hypothetical protein
MEEGSGEEKGRLAKLERASGMGGPFSEDAMVWRCWDLIFWLRPIDRLVRTDCNF